MSSNPTGSTLAHLECSNCGAEFEPDELQTFCHDCQAPLLARYDLQAAASRVRREEIATRPNGMWRWMEILPVRETRSIHSLGEGDTPLLRARNLGKDQGFQQLYVKDESSNPTGTFKARGLAVAVARAYELGAEDFVIPTAGNAGGALAAYAARYGARAHVFMPADARKINRLEVTTAGANLILVDGLIDEAGRQARQAAEQNGWFDVSTFKEPYRAEGKKVMGLELAEAFGWVLPDAIIYPTGGGTGLVGMWKAFEELEKLGWIGPERPRMISVQAAGCAPIVRAVQQGAERAEPWRQAQTRADGLRVPAVFADRLILEAIRTSAGTAVAVTDDQMLEAQRELATKEGIWPCLEGAATWAAARALVTAGTLAPEEKIVLFNTGTGLKSLDR